MAVLAFIRLSSLLLSFVSKLFTLNHFLLLYFFPLPSLLIWFFGQQVLPIIFYFLS